MKMNTFGLKNPFLGFWLLASIYFFGFSTGYEILFQQAKVTLTVPIADSMRLMLDKSPIMKLKVLNMTSPANSMITFSLDGKQDFLQLDKLTGELWFKQASWKPDSHPFYSLIVTAERSDGAAARMSIELTVEPVENFKSFCSRSLCFYESVTYHAIEDYEGGFKPREIGELSPKIYKRLCKNFEANYKLLNGSEFVALKDNKLFTSASLNHEMTSPGPNLAVSVQCTIQSDGSVEESTKIFNISVIDRNDNLIKVQDKVTNLTLNSPYFRKDTFVNPHSFIVFQDDDTSTANSNIEFHLLNDTDNAFKETCTKLQSNHTTRESTVFYCNLKFIKDGHYTSSPYCVILQARDTIKGKVFKENATVCIFTNLTITGRSIEFLPVPESLRDDKTNRKSRKIASNPATGEQRVSAPISIAIKYPDDAEVFQNASKYARVAEPTNNLTDVKIDFKLLKNPLNIFGITKFGGIVYVKNSTLLEYALPASHTIEVGWEKEVKSIKITIIEANSTCSASLPGEHFCSRHEFKEDCENACGFGSKTGLCQWRPFVGNLSAQGKPLPSEIYATCVADIATCSNSICDPLEKLGRSQEPTVHLCPQDCTTGHVIGLTDQKKQGIGKPPGELVCTCDHDESCICGKPHRVPVTTVPTDAEVELRNSSKDTFMMTEPMSSMRSGGSDCGTGCMIITVASPAFLVAIIVFLIVIRRRYVRKMKKRMLLTGPIHYRGSNDTEIIHINILNETHKENYQQTYQKFDFDAKWEFDRNKLILDTTLGEGEFGKVMKAYASDLNGSDSITTVAVKTVKTTNNSVELLALLSEFQLLQEVSHPNVIKLLGACIKGEPPMIIIEYCCFGSLRSYLRLSRKLEESSDLKIDGVEPITATDVLSFAWQICKGMTYLAEMKLVHRDLAARNVLLAEGKVCKVSDFGLTRDVYEDDAYLKKSKDRVPVKWMSPESLADHVYTTKTDVWSFGIVGYELITLGATPYPGIPPQNLYHLLRSGYRMERPENCSTEIYMLLEACWADDPAKRPTFKYLSSKFEKLLGRSAKYLDVDIDDGAISNPMYLANVDEITAVESTVDKKLPEDDEDESNRLNELWMPPKFKADANEVDNKKYLLKYDDQLQLLLARYDQPRTFKEARSISQKLRYQNDPNTFMPKNSYVNTSQPDLLAMSDREKLIESRYDTPKIKRNRSYVEMRNIARVRKASGSTTNDSFDDNNNEMPCNRTTINENLDFNDLDKLLNTDKEISFKFSSLNNLNHRLTMNETQC